MTTDTGYSHDLRVIQKWIVEWADEVIGHDRDLRATLWKLVMEEIPELADDYNRTGTLDPSEVGDVLILVLDLCHICGIDPAHAIGEKMDINESRSWKRGHAGVMTHDEDS